ncbi:PDZ domain-containing protein [Planctomicrobium sp. SH668]|uniref:PDZ domain-containing protein n=1 Tax=Planctomicrobium sp. SH668 TaxID=3448126 RepID=UPI003F5B199E
MMKRMKSALCLGIFSAACGVPTFAFADDKPAGEVKSTVQIKIVQQEEGKEPIVKTYDFSNGDIPEEALNSLPPEIREHLLKGKALEKALINARPEISGVEIDVNEVNDLASIPEEIRNLLRPKAGDLKVQAAEEQYVIGVSLDRIPSGIHKLIGIPENCGAIVVDLVEDGAAKAAGVQIADIVLKVNETPVESVQDVGRLIQKTGGTAVTLHIQREKEQKEITVTPQLMKVDQGDIMHSIVWENAAQSPVEEMAIPAEMKEALKKAMKGSIQFQRVGPGVVVESKSESELSQLLNRLKSIEESIQKLEGDVKELKK